MAIITSGTVRKLITENLHLMYPEIPILKTKVEQGFEKPCFFVRQLLVEQEKKGRAYERHYQFVIQYYPTDGIDEVEEVQEKLLEHFVLLKYDDLILRCSPKSIIKDEILQLFISYRLRLIKQDTKNPMYNIEELKGGIV